MMTISPETRFAVNPQVAWRVLDGHVFAVTSDNRQHELTGVVEHHLWSHVADNGADVATLISTTLELFEVDEQTATADLREFIAACLDAGLWCVEE